MTAQHHRLLFICTGNICRSPIAEVIAIRRGEEIGVPIDARSAGTLGIENAPADPQMVAVASELGLDLSKHQSQEITDDLIAWADYVLCMEMAHVSHVREFYQDAGENTLLLGNFGGTMDIRDPHGSWFRVTYRKSRDEIARCVHRFVDGVAGASRSTHLKSR